MKFGFVAERRAANEVDIDEKICVSYKGGFAICGIRFLIRCGKFCDAIIKERPPTVAKRQRPMPLDGI